TNGGLPQTVRDWSTSATFGWTPTTIGDYTVTVWTRSAGVITDASQASAVLTFAVTNAGPWITGGTHIADVNGDRRADLLLQGSENTFWLASSTGSGFSGPSAVIQHGGPFNWDGVHSADFNGDGSTDVLFQGFDNSFWLSLWTGA